MIKKWIYNHAQRTKTKSERFWEKVNKNGAIQPHVKELGNCWEWIGYKKPSGYGEFQDRSKHHTPSHKFAFEQENGAVEKGLCVCHKCDNPSCVRPSHLFKGTHKDNAIDRSNKGRGGIGIKNGAYTHPEKVRRGENHCMAKIKESDVIQIRKMLSEKLLSQEKIGAMFGIDQTVVSDIKLRKIWRHI